MRKFFILISILVLFSSTVLPATAQEFTAKDSDVFSKIQETLPENLKKCTSFQDVAFSGEVPDSDVHSAESMAEDYISEYENNGGKLHFVVHTEDLSGPYSRVLILNETHPRVSRLGNVVTSYDVEYYASYQDYIKHRNPCKFTRKPCAFVVGVAYYTPAGKLIKSQFLDLINKDNINPNKIPIIKYSWRGDIMVLLATNDTLLGWTPINGLVQYMDGTGNTRYPHPETIIYS